MEEVGVLLQRAGQKRTSGLRAGNPEPFNLASQSSFSVK